jgi:hypothetical protein
MAVHQPVALGRRPDHRNRPVIACTLAAHELGGRLAEWEATVADATRREPIDAGARLTFERDVDVAEIAALVAAEQACCQFFTFTLTVTSDTVALDVTGPAEAQPVIDALIGVAS